MSWLGLGGKKEKEEPKKELARIWTDQDFDAFVATCDDTSPEWTIAHTDEAAHLVVWTKKSQASSINIVRARKHFPNTEPDELYDVLHDHEYRTTWDENMIEGYTIEQLDIHNAVGYYAAKMPTPVSNRDFVNQRSWIIRRNKDPNEWIICNHSVHYPGHEEAKGFVRAWSYQTGYLIRPRPEGGCTLIYSTLADPRGWIPAFVLNMAVSVLGPRLVNTLERVLPDYAAWCAEHRGDSHRPWRTPPSSPYRGEGDDHASSTATPSGGAQASETSTIDSKPTGTNAASESNSDKKSKRK